MESDHDRLLESLSTVSLPDNGLLALYAEEIQNFEDSLNYSRRLKSVLKAHIRSILNLGISVVMDFLANTRNPRAWFKKIFLPEGIPHRLIYLDVDDESCIQQIAQRRKTHPERAQFDTEAVFRQVMSFFQPPAVEEGFAVEVVQRGNG